MFDGEEPAKALEDEVANATEKPLAEPMSLPDPEQPEGFSMEEVKTPKTPDHHDISPDADHIPFNGESPQNLPEPEEPEPAMLDSDLPKVHMELQKSAIESEEDLLPEHDKIEEQIPSSDEDTAELESSKEDKMASSETTESTSVKSTEEQPEISKSEEEESLVLEETEKRIDSPTEEKPEEAKLEESAVSEDTEEKAVESPTKEQPDISKENEDSFVLEETEKAVKSPTEEITSSIPSALLEPSHPQEEHSETKEDEKSEEEERVTTPEKLEDDIPGPEKPGEEELPISDDDDARAEECDGSDVSGGLTADDLAQCPEPEVPLDMPDMSQDGSMLHDSLLHMNSRVRQWSTVIIKPHSSI